MTRERTITLLTSEKGATLLEYALLACLIAVVALAGVTRVGNQGQKTFKVVAKTIKNAGGDNPDDGIIPGDGICQPGEAPPC